MTMRLLIGILVVLLIGCDRGSQQITQVPFDKIKWASETGFDSSDRVRFSMVEDLARIIKIGMDQTTVQHMLGEPYRKDVFNKEEYFGDPKVLGGKKWATKWIYSLTTVKSSDESMLLEFVVFFESNGKVVATSEAGE